MSCSKRGKTQIIQNGNNTYVEQLNLQTGAAAQVLEKVVPLTGDKIFIVHGHDKLSTYCLKNYLQNTLKYPEPTILSEVAGCGDTIIEAFEKEADKAGLIFVLLTPDDMLKSGEIYARQNVIFELGYFMGKYGRRSGRVILLLKGPVTLPSDLDGIKFISIDKGIEAAGEEIRRAINAVISKKERSF